MNFLVRLLLSGVVILAVAGCARREEDPGIDEVAADAAFASESAERPEPAKVIADIQARITLSDGARAELQARGDQVVVEAIFAGDPAPEAMSQVNELGLVELGKSSQMLSGPGEVSFDKSAIDARRLPLITGQPQLLLNVRSQQGLIVCPMYWESVETASKQTVEVACMLLSEAGGS